MSGALEHLTPGPKRRARHPARSGVWSRSELWLPALFVGIYLLAYTLPFPLPLLWPWHHTTFASLAGYHPLAAIGQVTASLLLVLLYRQAFLLAKRRPGVRTRWLLLAGWAGASLALLCTYPGQSTDIGDNIFYSHMLVHLKGNPLVEAPSAFIKYLDFPYLSWYSEPSYYGPLWTWLGGAVHLVARESLFANYLGFKLLTIAVTGLAGLLITGILRRRAPAYALAGLALWLWNPPGSQ